MGTFEVIDHEETQEVGIHLSLVGIGMYLECVVFHCTIDTFYHSVGLWGIGLCESVVNLVYLAYVIKCSCEISMRRTRLISLMISECIFFAIICEDFLNMEWEECDS